jgi:SAM-dependent methyltransferase
MQPLARNSTGQESPQASGLTPVSSGGPIDSIGGASIEAFRQPARVLGHTAAAPRFLRIGPVHFQPLERELDPLRAYFSGRVLNAGCGNRDISDTLKSFGATQIVNYDIASEIPDALIGPLEKMPFAAAEFDTILCNAVLEHVEAPELVMREMVRVLRPGGHLLVAIPFLQPFHPCPGDFRRYTGEGLRRLGIDNGLEVIAINPTHTIAQTLGWIIWAYLEEKKSRIRKGVLYPLLWCFTRYCFRTDASLIATANTFQAAYRKLP